MPALTDHAGPDRAKPRHACPAKPRHALTNHVEPCLPRRAVPSLAPTNLACRAHASTSTSRVLSIWYVPKSPFFSGRHSPTPTPMPPASMRDSTDSRVSIDWT